MNGFEHIAADLQARRSPRHRAATTTLAAMIDEFDAREYAAMMRARNVDV